MAHAHCSLVHQPDGIQAVRPQVRRPLSVISLLSGLLTYSHTSVVEEREDVQKVPGFFFSLSPELDSSPRSLPRLFPVSIPARPTTAASVSSVLPIAASSTNPFPRSSGPSLRRYVFRLLFTSSTRSRAHQDVRYLAPHVADVAKEDAERVYWDNVTVSRK
jgi:hypothetical protein